MAKKKTTVEPITEETVAVSENAVNAEITQEFVKTDFENAPDTETAQEVTKTPHDVFLENIKKYSIMENVNTPKVDDIEDVKKFIADHQEAINMIKAYMVISHKNAIGLAANQVVFTHDGESNRINNRFFLYRVAREDYYNPQVILNPHITGKRGHSEERIEGCLTWPDNAVIARRYVEIDVEYYDMNGEFHAETLTGTKAHVFQHEIDHLDGINEVIVPKDTLLPGKKYPERNDKCPCGSGIKFKKCCQSKIPMEWV